MILISFIARIPREREGGIVDMYADLSVLVRKALDMGSKKLDLGSSSE